MKLNADIIFENLKERVPTEMFGYKNDQLNLLRPEFYTDESKPLLSKHLYIMPKDVALRRTSVEKGAVIICLGDVPKMSFFQERCCFIKVKERSNPYEIYNYINNIYNKYETWYDDLVTNIENNSDIEELLALSAHIFNNPILLLNYDFKIISSSGYEHLENMNDVFVTTDSEELSISALEKYLQEKEILTHEKKPILIEIENTTALSLNLFDTNEYIGSITIEYRLNPLKKSDEALLQYLSKFIVKAMKRNTFVVTSGKNYLHKIFHNIINDMPLDISRSKFLEEVHMDKQFVCAVLQLNNRFAQIPVEYLCNKFEHIFPESITFEYNSNVISFIDVDNFNNDDEFFNILVDGIEILTNSMDINIGISSKFTDPFDAKQYYSEAQSALENGTLINPDNKYYFFKDYALMELLLNGQNNLPITMYFPDGLKRLFKHDENSSISYIDTLNTYLNCNMSVTAASKELYIHRSTFLERLSRIERELGEDLKNPNIRLQIQIVLKVLEIHKSVMDNNSK